MSNKRYEVNTPGVSPVDRDVTKLLYVSTAKYGGDWHSLMHTHACTELFYVVGGMGQFKVAEKLIPVSPDDLVIVNPNVEHTEVSLNASPLEYIVLGVEGMEFAADETVTGGTAHSTSTADARIFCPICGACCGRSSRNPQVTKSSARIFWRFWSLS